MSITQILLRLWISTAALWLAVVTYHAYLAPRDVWAQLQRVATCYRQLDVLSHGGLTLVAVPALAFVLGSLVLRFVRQPAQSKG